MNRQVNLTKRIRTSNGLRFCPVVISANGRVKPDYVLVADKEERLTPILNKRTPSLRLRLRVGRINALHSLSGDCPPFVRNQIWHLIVHQILRTMTNDNPFKAIIDTLPQKPARSRLEPYAELIRELRGRGRTYREIARILSERCGFQTSRSTVSDFVRAYLKRSRNSRKIDESGQSKIRPRKSVVRMPVKTPPKTTVTTDEIKKRIADLKGRLAPTELDSQIFHYDPSKPLHLSSKKKAEE
jgi:hypothetical protein